MIDANVQIENQELDHGLRSLLEKNNTDIIRENLLEKGFHIEESFFSAIFCQKIISFMDNWDDSEVSNQSYVGNEKNYGGTELRIWDAHKKSDLLADFVKFSNRFSSAIIGEQMEAFNLLAIRNKPVNVDSTQLTKGRWHIDSFKTQYKVFVFLTDTNERSGPFEFLPGTQRMPFKLNMLLKGKYIKPIDFVKGKRSYSSLPDEYINTLSKKYTPKPVICKRGTLVLIDTSALHRARPCVDGQRYALTSYYK